MDELASQRIAKALDRVFGRAIGRLQRNTAIRQCAANLYDNSAIARQHPFQRSERPINTTKISYLCYTPKFLGRHLLDWRKDRRHRVIDPNVNLAQIRSSLCGRALEPM